MEENTIKEARLEANQLLSIILNSKQLLDVELILDGSFKPLEGFLNEKDYKKVLKEMRLENNSLWPLPIVLDAEKLKGHAKVALRDIEGNLIAILQIESIWEVNKEEEIECLFGKMTQISHQEIHHIIHDIGTHYIGGKLQKLQLPIHFDFNALRKSPRELKELFHSKGWKNVIGYHTDTIFNLCHFHQTLHALSQIPDSKLLIHPSIGALHSGDIYYYSRISTFKSLENFYNSYFQNEKATVCLSPLISRGWGPKEVILQAIVQKNVGCSHFIVEENQASGSFSHWNPLDAFNLLDSIKDEIGITPILIPKYFYIQSINKYLPESNISNDLQKEVKMISEQDIMKHLDKGLDIPEWMLLPQAIQVLKSKFPPRWKRGFTVFFTGLSGAGKSTIANGLLARLMEISHQSVTLLDGDVVRTHLSSELGFSKEHRDINIKRIGYVAAEITKAGGITIAAAIAPYIAAREAARKLVENNGGFIEVYVSTPISVCEERDTKGLYAKARKGLLKGFTGIDDPYESPLQPEINIDTSKMTIKEEIELIVQFLIDQGFLKS